MELHHDCVVGGTVYSIYRRFGVPKLFRMADQGHWDQIPERVRKHPKEAFFVHKYAPCDGPLHRLLRPLHVPCPVGSDARNTGLHEFSTDIPTQQEILEAKAKKELFEHPLVTEMLLEAVKAIAQANPAATCKANMFGRTPLHLACMDITSSRAQVAEYLLRHTPMVAGLQDCSGCTALHFLLENAGSDIPDSLLVQFLRADPQALDRYNHDGQTPTNIYLQSAKNETEKQLRQMTITAAVSSAAASPVKQVDVAVSARQVNPVVA